MDLDSSTEVAPVEDTVLVEAPAEEVKKAAVVKVVEAAVVEVEEASSVDVLMSEVGETSAGSEVSENASEASVEEVTVTEDVSKKSEVEMKSPDKKIGLEGNMSNKANDNEQKCIEDIEVMTIEEEEEKQDVEAMETESIEVEMVDLDDSVATNSSMGSTDTEEFIDLGDDDEEDLEIVLETEGSTRSLRSGTRAAAAEVPTAKSMQRPALLVPTRATSAGAPAAVSNS